VTVVDDFDPLAPAHLGQPFALYEKVREEQPVFFSETYGQWFVTRYQDVRDVLNDPARYSSNFLIRTPYVMADGVAEILGTGVPETPVLLNEDPPVHAATRALVARAFTPRRMSVLEPAVQQLTDRLLDAWPTSGTVDLLPALAVPLPLEVICALIGIPIDDAPRIKAWTDEMTVLTAFGTPPQRQRDAASVVVEFHHYLLDLVALRRSEPADDLLSDVLQANAESARMLTDHEVVGLLLLMIFAGHETTTNSIAHMVHRALTENGLWRGLLDGAVDPAAVAEEVLRADAPVQGMYRVTATEVELGGVTIPAGQRLFLLFGSANRDGAVFADPDAFDPLRSNKEQHLSFGRGVHFCIGAALARLEMRFVLATLARRSPGLHLAPSFEPRYAPNLMHRALVSLDVTW
jgi:cytochrome P450